MEEVLELLQLLASKGVKLSVEGDDLNCYAQKGALTEELRERILRNKPQIIDALKVHRNFQSAVTRPEEHGKAHTGKREKSNAYFVVPVDLDAEAVLDAAIQPSVSENCVDFTSARTIFLTGSTGFLGAYLLHDLLVATDACVYCLIRCRSEKDGSERIKNNLLKYGLWSDDFPSRIVPVPGDLARPFLGVGEEVFDTLCNVIDAVYHSGAVVNFVYPYNNLKDSNVRGTQEVIRLACCIRRKPLNFVSTVGIFPPATDRNARVLESDPPPSNWQQLTIGYRQSKWVAEKIVTIAADRGLPVRIYRPGIVTGDSATGIWNTDDFLARVIKGCIQLGSAPDRDAIIDMVPVDYVSKAIVHLSRQKELQSNVFNVVNPNYISAGELGRLILSLGHKMRVVSYGDWRKELFKDAETSSENALYPLLSMFAEDAPLDLVPAFDCRYTLEGLKGTPIVCPEINTDLMATYLTYFRNCGFLDS